MGLTQECVAAPINNCVLIIHMILSASQLNVHTCVVDVRVCGGCTIFYFF